MKTFQDLEFKKHLLAIEAEKLPPSCKERAKRLKGAKHAVIEFDNGIVLSVVLGGAFYSNGVDTYECAVLNDKGVVGDVFAHKTKEQVETLMIDLQKK